MFTQLFIASQVRGGDIQKPFNHETRKKPPSLANGGQIRGEVKSDSHKRLNWFLLKRNQKLKLQYQRDLSP